MSSAELVLGRYHLGLMYSEAFAGVPYEQELFVGSVGKDDLDLTTRILCLLHETSHFVHDLSLGACMNRDILFDEAGVHLLQGISERQDLAPIFCPLAARAADASPVPPEFANALKSALAAQGILNEVVEIDVTHLAADTESGLGERVQLSGIDIAEGLVVVKTMNALAARASSSEDASYLADIVDDIPILPQDLPWTYQAALRLFDSAVARGLNGGRNPYACRRWPYDLLEQTGRSLFDTGFLLLADIALHVPPIEWIRQWTEEGTYPTETFDPVARFIQGINVIRNNGGFPQSDPSRNFYALVYDFIARKSGWPDHDETAGAWQLRTLELRDSLRRSVTDGYRFRLLHAKVSNSIPVVGGDPLAVCADNGVPIFHKTPTGLKRTRFWRNSEKKKLLVDMYELSHFPAWHAMCVDPLPWISPHPAMSKEALGELISRTDMTYLQELVMRAMHRALTSCMLFANEMSCPWSEGACDVRQPCCSAIRNLDHIPHQGCALRKYVETRGIKPSQIRWKTDNDERPGGVDARAQS